VSKPEGSGKSVELEAFERLESAIARLVRSVEESDRRAVSAESQVQEVKTQNTEMAGLVERFTESPTDAKDLMDRLKRLESENDDLRSRLDRGREGIERMITRIRFLENQR